MDNGKFSIFEAVKNAYLFAGREWVYLFKAGLLPFIAQVIIGLFIQLQLDHVGALAAWLWGLPATILMAWFTFVEVRVLLLNERLDQLPPSPTFQNDRLRALKISVIVSLLFNMAMLLAVTTVAALASSDQWGVNWSVTLGGLAILGGMFWGVRFALLPILAAVGYPFRPFINRVRGTMFSLRLVGMGAICLFPLAFLFQIFVLSFLSATAAGTTKLSMPEEIGLIVASSILSLLVTTLLNAAGAYALKEVLGGRSNGVLA